ncbi:BglG family transcription antiterminator [Streptobacillus felis]|uniref:BglG family transcription antiterminator n=1 Tax=Streptobacillus felis TaxID=1384509 RepID=A0A7Z0TAJ7_9FUSO|nr:PRD domain-containing protein [Streptobacillus felis]NYV28085.1 BglG family transcription antiterminator [Streptobacillus felis]
MDNELKLIYRILSDGSFHSAIELSTHLKLSDKTCRKYVKELAEKLKLHNINIISKTRFGYMLEGNILKENEIFNLENTKIPITAEDRKNYLIDKLIYTNEYIKLEDISDKIFISTKTLSSDIKNIENIFKTYSLKIDRKPHYGIRLVGKELNVRNFLIDNLEKRLNENKFLDQEYKYSINGIAKYVYTFLKSKNVKISDISLQNLIAAIYVTFFRVENNKRIKEIVIERNDWFLNKRLNVLECIKYIFLNLKFNLELDDNDIDYITIHFLTNETMTYKSIKSEDVNEVNDIIQELLYFVKLTFKIDLYNDEDLFKNLYTHILALLIRIRFDIKIKNPLLDDIKKNMPLEYNVATYVSNLISKRYNDKKLSEEEIGYIAVILHMSKGINVNILSKKNVLIVCPSGRGVSKFLIYTYNNLFSEYTNIISSCGENELMDVDLENVDVIFTLIDLNTKVNKPVYRINYFLNDEDVLKIKNILKGDNNYLKEIIPKSLFIYIDEVKSKAEIIKLMSDKLKKIPKMKSNIETLIHNREKLGMTEISTEVAIPHSIEVIEGVNVIGVCISKHPIKWINNEVNIILFLCLDNKNNKNEKIYEAFTKIVGDKEIINNILLVPTYENFINIIENIGGK